MVRIGNGDQRREMQDGVAVLHRGPHAVRVPDVARKHLEMAFHLRRAMVQPAPRIERVVEHEGADRLAGPNEGFGQLDPMKPSAPVTRSLAVTSRGTPVHQL